MRPFTVTAQPPQIHSRPAAGEYRPRERRAARGAAVFLKAKNARFEASAERFQRP
jgi:hypothetical protein